MAQQNVTRILSQVQAGQAQAAEELLPLVYEELRSLAARQMSAETPGQTLQPTALVHEAYVRLVGSDAPGWDSRGHFYAAAARAMRQILVNRAHKRRAAKHGGGRMRLSLSEIGPLADEPPPERMLALDEALGRLEEDESR